MTVNQAGVATLGGASSGHATCVYESYVQYMCTCVGAAWSSTGVASEALCCRTKPTVSRANKSSDSSSSNNLIFREAVTGI
jgi:hypothetical protein